MGGPKVSGTTGSQDLDEPTEKTDRQEGLKMQTLSNHQGMLLSYWL